MSYESPYYRPDLALVHHRGFGFHADGCGPDLVELLAPVRERDGLVLEIGCGSGLLTRVLVDAGFRVLATDASPAMLDLARETAPGVEEFAQLTLPDDPVPACDAVVGIGHPLNYLPTLDAIERALVALAARCDRVVCWPPTSRTSSGVRRASTSTSGRVSATTGRSSRGSRYRHATASCAR